MTLKLGIHQNDLEGLSKQIAQPHLTPEFLIQLVWDGLKNWFSKDFPNGADAAGLGTTDLELDGPEHSGSL